MRSLFLVLVSTSACAIALAQDVGGGFDHAGMIVELDDAAHARGKSIFETSCASCHGLDGNTTALPTARAFGKDPLRFGSDPYSLWKTITYGGGMMLPQTWLDAEERYAVIHYVREALIKPTNPDQYAEVTPAYLKELPEGTRRGTEKTDGWPRDFGPALSSQIERAFNHALTVRLDADINLSYDLHRFMVVGAWRGYLDLSDTQHLRLRGEGQPEISGERVSTGATWYWLLDETLDAPPERRGPRGIDGSTPAMPPDPSVLDFHGHHVYGDRVILSASIRGRSVLDMPGVSGNAEFQVIHHTLRVEPGEEPLQICVGDFDGNGWPIQGVYPLFGQSETRRDGTATGTVAISGAEADSGDQGLFVAVGAAGETESLTWRVAPTGKIILEIAASESTQRFRIYQIAGSNSGNLERFIRFLDTQAQQGMLGVPDLALVDQGGPRRWRETLITQGARDTTVAHYDPIDYEKDRGDRRLVSREHVPYVVDTIALPERNPWNAWMRLSCLAFFSDGRLAVGTHGGDVWIVAGIDGALEELHWQRHAAGLFEPMGMKVIDGEIYVTTRTGIIRLVDANEDGEADFYEQFFADPEISNGFHAYNFGLVRDSAENFYYVKPGLYTDYGKAGALLRIAPDGHSYEEIAHGFRVPNGLGISPQDTLYVSDNQGQWTPANEINRIEDGGFYGVFQGERWEREGYTRPALYLPQEFDNSPGSVVWTDAEHFGPLSGVPTHTSFGKGWTYYLLMDDGGDQVAAVAFPFQFSSGVMRSAVNPVDGQLYCVGLTGWDTESTKAEGCLQRVRYTGEAGCMLTGVRVEIGGIHLAFSDEVDTESAGRRLNYRVHQWNYRHSPEYGSDHWSVEEPREEGEDRIRVLGVEIGEDRKSVFLRTEERVPVEQMRLRFDIKSESGLRVKDSVYLSVAAL